jgi:coniferyl-aldehyde dehydrogenase
MGDYTNSPMMGCAVINRRQRDRVQGYIDDARERVPGSVIEIGSPAHAEGPNRMPLTLVVNPPQEALLCQHEIFGPVLPIHTYGDFDEVVEKIKTGERPLGVYIFSNNPDRIEQLRRNSSSGGFTVNGPSMQGALASLGFGGVGKSGMGRHHGIEGFREFSNPRGIVEIADNAQLDPILSPHGESTRQLIAAATNGVLCSNID